MSETRKKIRNAVLNRLKTLRVLGSNNNIDVNRAREIWTENLPAINIRTEDEAIESNQASPREFNRNLDIVFEVFVKDKYEKDLSDKLDTLCEDVENALFVDEFFNGLVNSIVLSNWSMDINESGSELQGAARLTAVFEYNEQRPSDRFNQKLDDLNTIGVTYKLSDSEDVEKPNDEVNFNA